MGAKITENKTPTSTEVGGEVIYHKKDVSYSESPKQDRTLELLGFSEIVDPSFIHTANLRQLTAKTNFSDDQYSIMVVILLSAKSKPLHQNDSFPGPVKQTATTS